MYGEKYDMYTKNRVHRQLSFITLSKFYFTHFTHQFHSASVIETFERSFVTFILRHGHMHPVIKALIVLLLGQYRKNSLMKNNSAPIKTAASHEPKDQ